MPKHAISVPQLIFKDAFTEDDAESESSSGSDAEEGIEAKPESKRKRTLQEQAPSLEELQEAGFRSGPSILTMKEQPDEQSFEWGDGRSTRDDTAEEDLEERERNRAAATHATEAAVLRAAEARRQLEAERQEHAAAQQKRRESYQQREKRKRDLGQAKKGASFVEEEKRRMRTYNVYSGFDQ